MRYEVLILADKCHLSVEVRIHIIGIMKRYCAVLTICYRPIKTACRRHLRGNPKIAIRCGWATDLAGTRLQAEKHVSPRTEKNQSVGNNGHIRLRFSLKHYT
jgi:hypothetical protein